MAHPPKQQTQPTYDALCLVFKPGHCTGNRGKHSHHCAIRVLLLQSEAFQARREITVMVTNRIQLIKVDTH